jgi:hypothetical protein
MATKKKSTSKPKKEDVQPAALQDNEIPADAIANAVPAPSEPEDVQPAALQDNEIPADAIANAVPAPSEPEDVPESVDTDTEVPEYYDTFVIPFVDSTAKWEELRYALRSIAKNVSNNAKVCIVGAGLPSFVNPDTVTLIECEQVKGMRFAKSYDSIEKLKAAINHPDVSERFVYTYDDTVILHQITSFEDVPAIAVSHINPEKISDMDGSAIWKEVLQNTVGRLKANNLPMLNYETHLPRVFTKEKVKSTIEKFGFQKRPYLFSTLYFNSLEEKDVIQLLKDAVHIKADIRKPLTPEEIKAEVKNKVFLNYNDSGLNEHLKDFLMETFPEKCRFEI